ncbi:MAG: DUF4124 domain-containing protein [Candidatus Competibacteraceae bacterium]|nr:DUF4124 domain-containing protein [Candidatus Competibacteraceae bacterium]
MHKTAAVLILLACMAPAHAVEIYRCWVNGFAHYQDKPCSGIVMSINTDQVGVGGLRESEVSAYLDSIERDVSRIGPHQSRQLEAVSGHLAILRQLVD